MFSFEIMMKKNTILLASVLTLGVFLFANISLAADTSIPLVSVFSIPSTSDLLMVPILNLVATDDVDVVGYFVGESSIQPDLNAAAWIPVPPSNYFFNSSGSKTLYAWARDAAGNISLSLSASVTLNVVVDAVAPSTPNALSVL